MDLKSKKSILIDSILYLILTILYMVSVIVFLLIYLDVLQCENKTDDLIAIGFYFILFKILSKDYE